MSEFKADDPFCALVGVQAVGVIVQLEVTVDHGTERARDLVERRAVDLVGVDGAGEQVGGFRQFVLGAHQGDVRRLLAQRLLLVQPAQQRIAVNAEPLADGVHRARVARHHRRGGQGIQRVDLLGQGVISGHGRLPFVCGHLRIDVCG